MIDQVILIIYYIVRNLILLWGLLMWVARESAARVIETERTVVRLAALSDIPQIIQYYQVNQEHLSRFDALDQNYLTETFWQRDIPLRAQQHQQGKFYRWFVFNPEQTVIIGVLSLLNVQRYILQSAYIGYGLAKAYCGRGLMCNELLPWAIEFAFNELKLHRLNAFHHPDNQVSHRLLKKKGFEQEGYSKQFSFGNARWSDAVMMGLVNRDWNAETAIDFM